MADLESSLPSMFFYVDELIGLMSSTEPISDEHDHHQSILDNIDMLFFPFTRALTASDGPDQSNVLNEVLRVVDLDEKSKAEGDCAICLEKLFDEEQKVVKETLCGHRFHANCIEKWLNVRGSCPLCRYDLMPPRVNEDDEDEDEEAIRRAEDDELLRVLMQIQDDNSYESYDYWTVEYLLYLFRDW